MKKLAAFLLCISFIVILAACGTAKNPENGDANPQAGAPSAPENTNTAGGEGAQEITLVATNWKFDQEEYRVKKGQEVVLTLDNAEGMHAVQVQGLNVKLTNNEKTVTFTPDKEGTYKIICSLPCGKGHGTMTSKLIVE